MDPSIPAGAAILLDFIRETEVGRKDRASYDVIYANKQNKLKQPLTTMTYGDIVDEQRKWSKNHGSSAAGGYQFMRATLIGLAKEILTIKGTDLFTPDLQDRLGYHLLKRRGYEAFVKNEISSTEFAKRLAMEWASFPVLVDTKGSNRFIKRGQSFYAGDGLNKALVKPEKVEAVLREVLATATRPVDFKREPRGDAVTSITVKPGTTTYNTTQPSSNARGIAALIGAALLAAGAWVASLPCSIFGVLCQ